MIFVIQLGRGNRRLDEPALVAGIESKTTTTGQISRGAVRLAGSAAVTIGLLQRRSLVVGQRGAAASPSTMQCDDVATRAESLLHERPAATQFDIVEWDVELRANVSVPEFDSHRADSRVADGSAESASRTKSVRTGRNGHPSSNYRGLRGRPHG